MFEQVLHRRCYITGHPRTCPSPAVREFNNIRKSRRRITNNYNMREVKANLNNLIFLREMITMNSENFVS